MQVRTRAVTLPTFVSSQESIEAAALKLLARELPIEVRLMGIRVSAFRSCPATPSQPKLETLLAPRAGARDADAGGEAEVADVPAAEHDAAAPTQLFGAQVSEQVASTGGPAAGCAVANTLGPRDLQPSLSVPEQQPVAPRCPEEPARGGIIAAAGPIAAASGAQSVCDATVGLPGHPAGASGDASTRLGQHAHTSPHNAAAGAAGAAAVVSVGQAHDAHRRGEGSVAAADEFVCSECGRAVARADEQEHMDWHVAQRVSAAVNGAGYISGTGRVSVGGKRSSEAQQRPEGGRDRSEAGPGEGRAGGRPAAGGGKRQRPAGSQLLRYFGPKAKGGAS